jgi:hypothetical protein
VKTPITIAFILLTSTGCIAQRQFALTVYQNTDRFTYWQGHYGQFETTSSKENRTSFHRISVALNIQSQKKFKHEIELFVPDIASRIDKVKFPFSDYYMEDPDRYKTSSNTYSIRYLFKRIVYEKNNFSCNIGAGINPYYVKSNFNSRSSQSYFWVKDVGASFNI